MEAFLAIVAGFVIGWMARKDSARRSAEDSIRKDIVQQLEVEIKHEPNEEIAAGLRKAATYVSNSFDVITPEAVTQMAAPEKQPQPSSSPQSQSILTTDLRDFDSVSVLLYFGAFLMIAGVGLFVGLSSFSGGVKTAAVLLLALALYGSGLLMHRYTERLKPAAITLTAIGLICLPLTGVAAYFYMQNLASAPSVWLVTSLASLMLYVIALWQIRQSLIGYLSIFMFLSLWLSIASVIQIPIYFFSWAIVALGILYLLGARYVRLWPELEEPMRSSAQVIVPAAIVTTFLFGYPQISPVHQGITMLLAAGFYAMATVYEREDKVRRTYFTFSYLLIPLATLFIIGDLSHGAMTVSFVLSVVTALQLIVARTWLAPQPTWFESATVVGALTFVLSSVVALPITTLRWGEFALLLSLNAVLHFVFAFWSKSKLHMAFGLITMLVLPYLIGFWVFNPALPNSTISGIYIALAALLMLVGRLVRPLKFTDVTITSYAMALTAAWLTGYAGPAWTPAISSLFVGLVVFAVAYFERSPKVIYGGTILGVIAAAQGIQVGWNLNSTIILGSLGLLYYLVAKISQYLKVPTTYNEAWLVGGLVTMYLGSFIVSDLSGVAWANIGYLGLAGAITVYESYFRRNNTGVYVGGGVVLAALQLMLHKIGLHAWQPYWYIWALYFTALAIASHNRGRNDEKQTFTILALTAVTLPFTWLALQGDTGAGLWLLLQSVGVLLGGQWLRYRLVTWWGLAVAVGLVLYQLREFQFFVLVLLGAIIIGLGVYMLLRQEKNK